MNHFNLKLILRAILLITVTLFYTGGSAAVEKHGDWVVFSNNGMDGAGSITGDVSYNVTGGKAMMTIVCTNATTQAIGIGVQWISSGRVSRQVELQIDNTTIVTGADSSVTQNGPSTTISEDFSPNLYNRIIKKLLKGNSTFVRTKIDGKSVYAKFSLSGVTKASYKARKQCGFTSN